MANNYFMKVVLLSVFVFLLINCTKKQEENKVIEHENNTISKDEIENNVSEYREIPSYDYNETKSNLFEYRGIPNYYYADIKDLLIKKNKKEVNNVLDNPFHFGASLEYLSYIKLDIDITEGETWFSSWYIPDSISASYHYIYLHIIKDDNIIKTYWMLNYPLMKVHFSENKYIEFPILENIPGKFFTAWLYDINKDGYDEIIAFREVDSEDYPRPGIEISGYDKNKDEFVTYLHIIAVTIDEEKGPDPIQYIQNQGVWGFRCLMDSSIYTLLYGIPIKENENFVWVFFTWDSDERKYIEKEFIE